jgi:ribosomal protein S18 acetylase RimI-like enzyme
VAESVQAFISPVSLPRAGSEVAVREHRHRESHPGTRLRRVNWSTDLETVRRLFRDYRTWLADHGDPDSSSDSAVGLGLSQMDQQIAELPGAYGPPRGDVILAFAGGALVACGALRAAEPKVGEIKRIYVRADHRGPGFGPRLTRALLGRARAIGYERVRVDTLPTMTAAIQFYQEMGFAPIPAYWPHPVPGALFFEYSLKNLGNRLGAGPIRKRS